MEKESLIINQRNFKETEKLAKFIEREKEKGTMAFNGELEKSEKFISLINLINEIFKKEFKEINLSEIWSAINYKQVHLLNLDDIEKNFPGYKKVFMVGAVIL